MKLLVLGATGPTGIDITRKALASGFEVNVMVRSPGKLPEDIKEKCTVFRGELSDEATILASLEGVDAVISGLGPLVPGNPPGLPITQGYRLIIQCMRQKGIRRIIALSTPSFQVKEHDGWNWISAWGTLPIKWFASSAYNDVVATGQLFQEQTDLDWTLYRVGWLQNSDEETGRMKAGYAGEAGLYTYRKDVAKFCIDEVVENKWIRKVPWIYTERG